MKLWNLMLIADETREAAHAYDLELSERLGYEILAEQAIADAMGL